MDEIVFKEFFVSGLDDKVRVWNCDKLIVYSEDGVAVHDHEAEDYALRLNVVDFIHISTENVFTCARVLIKEGKIKHNVSIYLPKSNTQCFIDKNGRMDSWPSELNRLEDWLSRLM